MLKRFWARLTSIQLSLVAATLFASAILHILATLATPRLIPASGYSELAGDLARNTMHILPDVGPETQPLPFMSPDSHYAVCRFDTKDGAVSVSALLPEPGWVLALYSPAGDNFFTTVASPARRPDVSLLLVPGDEAWREGGSVAAVTGEATLTIPANKGLAVIRAPDRGESYSSRALAELKRATCAYRRSPTL